MAPITPEMQRATIMSLIQPTSFSFNFVVRIPPANMPVDAAIMVVVPRGDTICYLKGFASF